MMCLYTCAPIWESMNGVISKVYASMPLCGPIANIMGRNWWSCIVQITRSESVRTGVASKAVTLFGSGIPFGKNMM